MPTEAQGSGESREACEQVEWIKLTDDRSTLLCTAGKHTAAARRAVVGFE